MTDPSDIASVARGLTKGQREAVGWFEPGVLYDYHRLVGHVRVKLFAKNLISATKAADRRTYMLLTPLGLAVRDHLRAGGA